MSASKLFLFRDIARMTPLAFASIFLLTLGALAPGASPSALAGEVTVLRNPSAFFFTAKGSVVVPLTQAEVNSLCAKLRVAPGLQVVVGDLVASELVCDGRFLVRGAVREGTSAPVTMTFLTAD